MQMSPSYGGIMTQVRWSQIGITVLLFPELKELVVFLILFPAWFPGLSIILRSN